MYLNHLVLDVLMILLLLVLKILFLCYLINYRIIQIESSILLLYYHTKPLKLPHSYAILGLLAAGLVEAFQTLGVSFVIWFPSFPPAIIDVYGNGIKIQYDYYHIIQDAEGKHLNKSTIDYYRFLAETKQFDRYNEIRKFHNHG